MKNETIRYRARFDKTEAMRFTGHLDLFRTLERTMRRANMPLAYSQGFNPRPKMMLASALPLGYTSEHEELDFWLEEERPLDEIAKALHAASPPGIVFRRLESVPLEAEKLQNALESAIFVATLKDAPDDLDTRLADFLSTQEVLVEKVRKRKAKMIDLRALTIYVTQLAPDEQGRARLEMHLRAVEGATGRPDDVLTALGIDPLSTLVHRTALQFAGRPKYTPKYRALLEEMRAAKGQGELVHGTLPELPPIPSGKQKVVVFIDSKKEEEEE